MSEQSESFASKAEALFEGHFEAFVAWLETNWKIQPRDTIDDGMTPEMREGWDRCCDSIGTAFQVWTDDLTP